MSLILEALRKSEAERRRGETPSVHSELPPAPRAPKRRMPPVGAWLGMAIVLGLAAWGVRALLGHPSTPAPAPTMPRAHAELATRPARRARPASLPRVRHLTPAPLVEVAPAVASTTSSAQPPADAAPSVPSAMPVPAPAPPAAAAPPLDDTTGLSDLDPEQRKLLPPLKLSMHMWNDDPSQRFVILDGNRLREGDRIGDAVVTAITRDGVVLDWNGRKLKLPIR